MRYPKPRGVTSYNRYVISIIIAACFIVLFTFFYFLAKAFKKDVEKVRLRYEHAETYFGKDVILTSDTLEVLDYRLGQFMLSDRTWISEDVVFRLIDK